MWPYDLIYPFIDNIVAQFDGFLDSITEIGWIQDFAADANAFATVETIHALAATLVVGTILFVDLRLLGFIGRNNAVTRASRILSYTWIAFLFAALSGLLLWAVNATRYSHAEPFQVKMLLILAAGINMAVFHFGIWQSVGAWDENTPTPAAAKVAGTLSLLFWIGALFYGRFTYWML